MVVGWGCCLLAIMLRFPLLWAVLPTSFYFTYGKAFRDRCLESTAVAVYKRAASLPRYSDSPSTLEHS